MLLNLLLFVLGFAILIKGADFLVSGAGSIARKYHVPDLVIGLTIVSFGTSLPELLVNLTASLNGSPGIAIGNVLGSNIANVLLILGISSIIKKIPIGKSTLFSEIPFSLAAALLVGFLANAAIFHSSNILLLSQVDGGILLLFFMLFMAYIVSVSKNSDIEDEVPATMSMGKSIVYILIGIVGLYFGGEWVVNNASEMALEFGFSETFIGLTIVAIGTSLPELVTSIVAAKKDNMDIAVGNVVGSNIFNLLWILGLSSLIKPLPFTGADNYDILVIIFSSSLIILAVAVNKKNFLNKLTGVLFLLLYALYIVYLFYRDRYLEI